VDIEELRRRVEAKRQQREITELKRELYGQNNEIDPDVIYLSTEEVAKKIGITRRSVTYAINVGYMPRSIRIGKRWYIHPDDANQFIQQRRLHDSR